jgi:hypothetical protein
LNIWFIPYLSCCAVAGILISKWWDWRKKIKQAKLEAKRERLEREHQEQAKAYEDFGRSYLFHIEPVISEMTTSSVAPRTVVDHSYVANEGQRIFDEMYRGSDVIPESKAKPKPEPEPEALAEQLQKKRRITL